MKYIIPVLGSAALALAGPIPSTTKHFPAISTSCLSCTAMSPKTTAYSDLEDAVASIGHNRHVLATLGQVFTHTDVPRTHLDVHAAAADITKRSTAMSAASWVHAVKEMVKAGTEDDDMEEWSRLISQLRQAEMEDLRTDPSLTYRLERADRLDGFMHTMQKGIEILDKLKQEGYPKENLKALSSQLAEGWKDEADVLGELVEEIPAEKKKTKDKIPQPPSPGLTKESNDKFFEEIQHFKAAIEAVENSQDDGVVTTTENIQMRVNRWAAMERSLNAEVKREVVQRQQEESWAEGVNPQARTERTERMKHRVSKKLELFKAEEEAQNKAEEEAQNKAEKEGQGKKS